ncbi:TPA: hypothetical protein EYN23_26470 [Candidatus Poribacteria bacterium]|nr:hypothetical protein [Candidatus Poribacteria bacterium]
MMRIVLVFSLLLIHRTALPKIPISIDGQSVVTTIQIGVQASVVEIYAAEELQIWINRLTETKPPIITTNQLHSTPTLISIGIPQSSPEVRKRLDLPINLGNEGYRIKSFEDENRIMVGAHSANGVLYGCYHLLELMVSEHTGLTTADLDFIFSPRPNLALSPIDQRSQPFYPVRAVLEVNDPDWLARHRINMSGGEGIWNGTGIDDGLGTAFQYVDAARFELFQDLTGQERRQQIETLRNRFDLLRRRGIDSYLFMYVTGEPTEALIRNRPQLLGQPVPYGGSRNGVSYKPLCWSKPELHQLVAELVQEIVVTYPTLSGFHLRCWGYETRSCQDCPQCGGQSEAGQKMLWKLMFTVIQASRKVRPDFKFYISGYDRFWLKDPDGSYAARLPQGTIFSQKWGYDGEPSDQPNLSPKLLSRLGGLKHRLIILSHEVEEVMPLWMVEGDLFVNGVRRFPTTHPQPGLAGFTVQGAEVGLGQLDRLLSARINWNPKLDHLQLMRDFLTNRYQVESAGLILKSLRISGWALSNYFTDYAGTLTVTGQYGKGSAGFATRFWDIIGQSAVTDIFSIPDEQQADYAVNRLAGLLPQMQEASNLANMALAKINPVNVEATYNLKDTQRLLQMWTAFFESRLSLAEAVQLGYKGGKVHQVQDKLNSAIEYTRSMVPLIRSIGQFVPVFGYSRLTIETSLVEKLTAEVALIDNFAPETIMHQIDAYALNQAELKISGPLNFPNPLKDKTTFTYQLSRTVDDVSISIYTKSGRLICRVQDCSSRKGYNEQEWDGRDWNGSRLANGVYFYKILVKDDGDQLQAYGRLAILR